ncbi:MAG: sulfatase [Planctomycetaceae bacterium]|nr:sulfatase [Planctomycetaceae bacterium]
MLRILACLLLILVNSQLVGAADSPNLLIITVDDMSADSIGLFGCPIETTPRIDELGRSGMRFEYAHVQVGNCMPSRNVMWSGRYPHTSGVEGFYQVKKTNYPVLCDLMQSAGYWTGIRGKVPHSTPYSPYKWDGVLDSNEKGKPYALKDPAGYGDATRQGIVRAREAGKKFCLVINVSDPHKPFYSEGKGKGNEAFQDPFVPSRVFTAAEVPVPGFLFEDPEVREELALYYSSVRRADDCVGKVLDALNESGLEEETIILFLSDHGMPLPFAKTQLYHHSTHTPLIVRWPGVTKAGAYDQTHMVSAIDFLPTILEMTGVAEPSGLQGRSFASILRGQSQDQRDFVIKEYNENAGASRDPMRAVQTKQYLYLFNPWSNGERVMASATTGTVTYRRLAKLAKENSYFEERHDLYQHRVPEELYDISKDPDCLHNLIAEPDARQELTRLRSELEDWMNRTEDPLLHVYLKRDDAAYREAAIQKLEQEALERRNGGKKEPGKKGNKKNSEDE